MQLNLVQKYLRNPQTGSTIYIVNASWFMTSKQYYVYILSNRTRRLYIGVTSNLAARIWQHKQRTINGFTKKYNINRLVYFEYTENPMDAICREKQVKKYRREKKIALIESINPDWKDLAEDWDASDAW